MRAATAPLVFLGFAVFIILFNVLGIDSILAGKLLAHYAAALPGHATPRPLLPLRLAEIVWLLAVGGGAVWLLRKGVLWSGLACVAGTGLAAWAGWVAYLRLNRLFDAASVGLALLLLALVILGTWALSLWLAG